MKNQIKDGLLTGGNLQSEHHNYFVITGIWQEWQEFYWKYFQMAVDLSGVTIPDNPGGFDRVIYIPQGLRFASIVNVIRGMYYTRGYIADLDKDVPENVRTTAMSYAIRVRKRVEADEELKNLSANQLQKRGKNTITLLERLIYGLKYFDETNNELDITGNTLCAGSRGYDGSVPYVGWDSCLRELTFGWCNPGRVTGCCWRARQVVF